jgi:hypothetical protein
LKDNLVRMYVKLDQRRQGRWQKGPFEDYFNSQPKGDKQRQGNVGTNHWSFTSLPGCNRVTVGYRMMENVKNRERK